MPLVVRVPEKWQASRRDSARAPGSRALSSFIDFGPTVLHLAGLDAPARSMARPSWGRDLWPSVNARDEAFGYADRFDEKYDLVPLPAEGPVQLSAQLPALLSRRPAEQLSLQDAGLPGVARAVREGKLNAAQRRFFEAKAPEALYDVEADPHEVRNLAGDPAHAKTLRKLRGRLQARVKALPT